MNVAVGLGVLAATAALAGALVVGDSMRGSLEALAVARLGPVDHALRGSGFFDASLAETMRQAAEPADGFEHITPIILLPGGATHATSRARVEGVRTVGVGPAFAKMYESEAAPFDAEFSGRVVILNEPLARELGAAPGDDILLRIAKAGDVPTESLLGRKDDTHLTLRLTVHDVIPAAGAGAFGLAPQHRDPRNAFVPLATLQRLLDRRGRVNTILVAADGGTGDGASRLQHLLERSLRLADVGLRIRVDSQRGYAALESDRFLLQPAVEAAVRAAAAEIGATPEAVLTYLANQIRLEADAAPEGIPYSTVTALDTHAIQGAGLRLLDGNAALVPGSRGIWLHPWAADDLRARPGDEIVLTYYVSGPFGRLETTESTFVLRGVVRAGGGAVDPGFTPNYPGVTDTQNMADWDPPFPIDLGRVRDKDEDYWDRHRTAPKAFVALKDGQELWAEHAERFGRLTSIRVRPAGNETLLATAEAFEASLLAHLDASAMGMTFEPVMAQAIAAARGSTDFGGLFIGFSLFLIVAAAMLIALLFRLGVERRSSEIGLLLATGFSPSRVRRLLLAEGAVVAGIGAAMGLFAACGYAWLMLSGLRTWWSGAVNAPFLRVHVTPLSMSIGFVASFLIAMISIAWSLGNMTKRSPRSLLAGAVQAGPSPLATPGKSRSLTVAWCAFGGALIVTVLGVSTEAMPEAVAFFAAGALTLTAGLAATRHRLLRGQPELITQPGTKAFILLGIRNAPRQVGRSMLTIGLIASATFVITALQAFRIDVDVASNDKHSGTGGFALVAESAVPLLFDLNTPQGRESLNLDATAIAALNGTTVYPLRLRPGDESSCANLYIPTRPRIAGATEALIERGGFSFASTVAGDESEEANPWRLLDRSFADGAIAVIGDEAAVKWQLHRGLGKDLIITDDLGREVRLRFVALLKGSALQGELVVSERNFVRMFPSISGYGFFLIETSSSTVRETAIALERELTSFGFDATPTADRLTSYFAVQNTYLSTFQTLGGLGLVLGTVGLAAVVLRNVRERRGELALMRAVGFSRGALGWVVLSESTWLVIAGLLAGVVPAMVAVGPHLWRDPSSLPWLSVGLTLSGVLAVGVGASAAALVPTLRSPLLQALRSE